jgi:retron-type reverse transcriptase
MTKLQRTTSTQLRRIAWLSEQDKQKHFDRLIHHINVSSLKECFNQMSGSKAIGIDGVTKEEYEANLDENLEDLVSGMKQMSYRPGPSTRSSAPGSDTQRGKVKCNASSRYQQL